MTTLSKQEIEDFVSLDLLDSQIRILSNVPRWTIIRTIQNQNVAEHSYYVALYVNYITRWLGYDPLRRLKLIQAALMHDMDEMLTGDIPAPAKKRHLHIQQGALLEDLSGLTNIPLDMDEKNILKAADLFEACMFLSDETDLGNDTIPTLQRELIHSLKEVCNLIDGNPGNGLYDMFMEKILDPVRTKTMTTKGWVK